MMGDASMAGVAERVSRRAVATSGAAQGRVTSSGCAAARCQRRDAKVRLWDTTAALMAWRMATRAAHRGAAAGGSGGQLATRGRRRCGVGALGWAVRGEVGRPRWAVLGQGRRDGVRPCRGKGRRCFAPQRKRKSKQSFDLFPGILLIEFESNSNGIGVSNGAYQMHIKIILTKRIKHTLDMVDFIIFKKFNFLSSINFVRLYFLKIVKSC